MSPSIPSRSMPTSPNQNNKAVQTASAALGQVTCGVSALSFGFGLSPPLHKSSESILRFLKTVNNLGEHVRVFVDEEAVGGRGRVEDAIESSWEGARVDWKATGCFVVRLAKGRIHALLEIKFGQLLSAALQLGGGQVGYLGEFAIDYKIGDDGTVTERRLPDAAFEDTTTEVITAVVEIAVAQPREDAHKRCFDFLELTTEQINVGLVLDYKARENGYTLNLDKLTLTPNRDRRITCLFHCSSLQPTNLPIIRIPKHLFYDQTRQVPIPQPQFSDVVLHPHDLQELLDAVARGRRAQ